MKRMWFVTILIFILLVSQFSAASGASWQTEADLSAEFKQTFSAGFIYQNATLLFHELDLAAQPNPQEIVMALIQEGEGLVQKTKRMKSHQFMEFKISAPLAKALGVVENSKLKQAYGLRMRVAEGREKIQEALKSLAQMNDLIFQGGVGNPVRSPDSEKSQKFSWKLFQWRLFAISSQLYK